MDTLGAFDLFSIGFFIGLGWWAAKAIFVIVISKWLGEPLKVSTGDS